MFLLLENCEVELYNNLVTHEREFCWVVEFVTKSGNYEQESDAS